MSSPVQTFSEIKDEYFDFLYDKMDQGIYSARIHQMLETNMTRLVVNINDLREKYPQRASRLLNRTSDELPAFLNALNECVSKIKPGKQYLLGFEGSFGSNHVTPRQLTSHFIGRIVCVDGVISSVSLVRAKLLTSVSYCPATSSYFEKKYEDGDSPVIPTKDALGNSLELEYGLSVYENHQVISIQEVPEMVHAGQIPRTVNVVCNADMCDQCIPGNRVKIVGHYRCRAMDMTAGIVSTDLIANNIVIQPENTSPGISREDISEIRRLSKRDDIVELLSNSLAPSIHGHEYVKKAILCLLMGGVEKNLVTGTRLRGDINVLLIGDPSVAKSQLLRAVLHTAPRAISANGRGASGVGLTAAVINDPATGERRLEAGAMVLADRGIVCIDEFDKMSDIDRTAIHEVMEQGRVTINKAGIHTSLNARCAVLAAANPVYGRYDSLKTPMENIGMQDSLLSRFDLVFILLDTIDVEMDTIISEHVVRMHRYRDPREEDGEVLMYGRDSFSMLTTLDIEPKDSNLVFEKFNPILHGKSTNNKAEILSPVFVKKYISLAKCIRPKLTTSAGALIANEYARLRCDYHECARSQPVTVRSLETMIRLATAHAKMRLRTEVGDCDANFAIEMLYYAYFKKQYSYPSRKREPDTVPDICLATKKTRTSNGLSSDQFAKFKRAVQTAFREARVQSLPIDKIAGDEFTPEEISLSLQQMTVDNQILVVDNIVFLI